MAWEKIVPARRTAIAAPVGISIAWIALVLAAAWFTGFDEPYLPFVIGGAFVFFLRSAPSRWEIYSWLLTSALLVKVIHLPLIPFWVLRVASSFAVLGFGALLLLGLRAVWSEGKSRSNALALLAPALVLIFFIYGCARVLQFTSGVNPLTDDAWLYAFDGTLGFQPSFLMGRLMYDSVLLTRSVLLTYLSLPFAMAVLCAWQIPLGETRIKWHMLTVLLLAGAGGWVLYNIVPGTGPIYAFAHDFPTRSIAYKDLPAFVLQKMSLPTSIPRNAMPSLHVGWALLLWWNSRKFPATLRAGMLLFLLLTVVATLGTGQHYLVDLVVSLPFALTVQAVASYRLLTARRITAAVTGGGFVAGWLLLIRFGIRFALISPVVPWSLILITVSVSLWLEDWMSRENLVEPVAGNVPVVMSGLVRSTR
jgi:PAP2 superfamily